MERSHNQRIQEKQIASHKIGSLKCAWFRLGIEWKAKLVASCFFKNYNLSNKLQHLAGVGVWKDLTTNVMERSKQQATKW